MRGKTNTLGLIMPTIEPNTLRKLWLPSLENLVDAKDYINICINFQDPYTVDDALRIVEEIKSYGFTVYYTVREKYHVPSRGLVPFNRIRNDTVMLNPNSKFYVLTDDDFSYLSATQKSPNAGIQYLRAIHYLLKFDNCGCLLTGGSMYRYNPINTIGPTKCLNREWYITSKSLFLRSMSTYGFELFPNDSLDLYGAKEESLLCACRLNEGFYPAKMGNTRVKHDEGRCDDEDIKPGFDQFGWLDEEIVENNIDKYLREHYGTDTYGLGSNCFVICNEDTYYKKGGIDIIKEREKFFIDYSDYSKDRLISEIDKMIEKGE